jgi:hypothetical protein
MKIAYRILLLTLAAGLLTLPPKVMATDVDGPDDCQKAHEDWGDAPEHVLAYPGVMGHFPTCLAPSAPGTQQLACPPISTPPGPTGYVRHIQGPGGYWLGCYSTPGGFMGIDTDPDGKANSPAVGFSACAPGSKTDCVENAFGLTFDQDECYGDGSDAGLLAPPVLTPCAPASVTFNAFTCAAPRQVFLNILVDMNEDGDWNDNFVCPSGVCAYEWGVKNALVVLPPGCTPITSPSFMVAPRSANGRGWMRITLTDFPVSDDFPWAGSAGTAQAAFQGGETEDYPVAIQFTTGSRPGSWGQLKRIYR